MLRLDPYLLSNADVVSFLEKFLKKDVACEPNQTICN